MDTAKANVVAAPMNRILLVAIACCALTCVLGLGVGAAWLAIHWDRIPEIVAGDSYDDWRRGGSMPWPGGGAIPTAGGASIAYSSPKSGRGDIYVWDRATGASRQLTDNDDFEGQPAFSPDDERIAYQRQEQQHGRWRIWIMNADGSQQRPISKPERGNDSYPQFTADGKRVRFLRSTWAGGKGQHAEYREVDLAKGRETPAAQSVAEPVVDAGQTWEVGSNWDMRVWIRNKGTGERRVIAEGSYVLLVNNESDVLCAGPYARGLFLIGVDGTNRRPVFEKRGYVLGQPRRHGASKVVFILDTLGSQRALEMWEVDASAETSQLLTRVD